MVVRLMCPWGREEKAVLHDDAVLLRFFRLFGVGHLPTDVLLVPSGVIASSSSRVRAEPGECATT